MVLKLLKVDTPRQEAIQAGWRPNYSPDSIILSSIEVNFLISSRTLTALQPGLEYTTLQYSEYTILCIDSID